LGGEIPERQPSLAHAYCASGNYTVTVAVADGDGGSDSDSFGVEVTNSPPQVASGGPINGFEGTGLALDGASVSDPDVKESHTATVDSGDGTIDPVNVSGSGDIQKSHTYADNGVYTVTVKACDSNAACDAATTTATIANVAPKITVVVLDQPACGTPARLRFRVTDPPPRHTTR
jgi:PKD repeat protein